MPQKLRSGNGGAEIGHERLDVVTAAAGLVQRIFEQHIGCSNLVDDREIEFLPQKSVNQRPTTALLSASLLIEMSPHAVSVRVIEFDR